MVGKMGGLRPAASSGRSGEESASAYNFAAVVLAEMRKLGVLPTPSNYEVWFNYRVGACPDLTRRVEEILASDKPSVTPALLSELHGEFFVGAVTDTSTEGDADSLSDIARDLSEQVTSGHQAIQAYDRALTTMAGQLGSDPTIGSLVTAIAAITAETARASERNRILERQLVASSTRIDKLKQTLSSAKTEAATDPLTGLLNRRAFEARLRRCLVTTRNDEAATLSVLLLDVDHFKTFNDSHGHAAGDYVLRMLGRVLTESVKGRDTVARYGGEEFTVLLPDTPAASAAIVATQIAEAVATKRLVNRKSHQELGPLTVSVGVTQVQAGDVLSTVLGRADAALYRAKGEGRNRVVLA